VIAAQTPGQAGHKAPVNADPSTGSDPGSTGAAADAAKRQHNSDIKMWAQQAERAVAAEAKLTAPWPKLGQPRADAARDYCAQPAKNAKPRA
jgi:hypothetical protein